ncbi:MAG TPA: hypothetical protein VJZ68_00355 [Nitrososphaera sp.]|nr:hypothetical protein [Nitrososphaera sp.]
MKISELCKMIEDSLRSGRYPLDTDAQKKLAGALRVINRSDSEDLESSNIRIETRVQELYVINNYIPNIQHLPGVIELDVVDSFKMICRKLERLDHGIKLK